jgi:hypothetical protein
MADDPIPADAARAMHTVIRSENEDRTARGRFGRDVPKVAPADVQDAMPMGDAFEGVEALGYQVDADAVAGAIIDRLLAGRTLSAGGRDA